MKKGKFYDLDENLGKNLMDYGNVKRIWVSARAFEEFWYLHNRLKVLDLFISYVLTKT